MLSIIVINYNTFKLTVDCIKSVMEKTACEHEIILVDNASTECDPKGFKDLFPFIKLVRNTENLGFAKGNNAGLSFATGDHVLLLNSDTVLINDAIDLSYARMQADDNIGALSCQLVSPDGTLQQASHKWSELGKLAACTLKLHYLFKGLKPQQPDLTQEHKAEYLYGTFFMFPKKVLQIFESGKLPETFFMYSEDAQWSHLIREAGYDLLYYPEAKILHYGGSSSDSNDEQSWQNGFQNEYRLHHMVKGSAYTYLYYTTLVLFYLTSFKKQEVARAGYVFKHLFKPVNKSF